MEPAPPLPFHARAALRAALLFGALAFGPAADAQSSFSVAAPPTWVRLQSVPDSPPLQGERIDRQYLLDDEQVRVTSEETAVYRHRAWRIASVPGIEDGSQVTVAIDPAYERLAIHEISLVRDGARIDALRPDDVKVVQRERELDRRIYDGELSILAFLHDVRLGDVVDVAWTVYGANPALAGHFAWWFGLAHDVPVGRIHRRLLWPSERPLFLRSHGGAGEAERREGGAHAELVWSHERTSAIQVEDDAPPWHSPFPKVQISDFETWEDVVLWALPHYRPEPLGAELSALASSWSDLPTEEAKVLAAVRFTQDDVRYLGIEIGPRGLLPHSAQEVATRRFGDCKDKAMLLVSLLRSIGVDAAPALVSTTRRHTVRDLHPTPYAFNHAIVRVALDGATYWVDATRALERGPLSGRPPPDVGVALVLDDGERDLTPVGARDGDVPEREVVERYTLADLDGRATLVVTSTYRGREATRQRYRVQSGSVAALTDDYLRFYQRDIPSLQSTGPVEIFDEPDGSVRLVERYRADTFWKDGGQWLTAWSVSHALVPPPSGVRSAPLHWEHPLHIAHRVEVALPAPFVVETGRESIETGAFSYHRATTYEDDVITIAAEVRSHRDAVGVDELEAHRAAIEEAREDARTWLDVDAVDPGMSVETKSTIFALAASLAILGGGSLRRRGHALRKDWKTFRRVRADAGTEPESAVLVDDTVDALRVLGGVRCVCGGALQASRRTSRTERRSQHVILRIEAPCASCSAPVARYFRFRE